MMRGNGLCLPRRRVARWVAALFVSLCLTTLIYSRLPDTISSSTQQHSNVVAKSKSRETKVEDGLVDITVVIRDFEDFENAVEETVSNVVKSVHQKLSVLVVTDKLPYPPINVTQFATARLVTLAPDLNQVFPIACPLKAITTTYALFLPDGVKVDNWTAVHKASLLLSSGYADIIALEIIDKALQCSPIHVSYKQWTVFFNNTNKNNSERNKFKTPCAYVTGRHALLTSTKTLQSLTLPLARPWPLTFYLQASLKGKTAHILKGSAVTVFRQLYNDFHGKWKRKQMERERLHEFYRQVGIKQEISSSGLSTFFGCNKESSRCFGTVINDMPDYLYQGRWTPPCCLQALRKTLSHVVQVLDSCNARYWLEGGSLLGAVRHSDIIPWDYDIDLGIYKEDIIKCSCLSAAMQQVTYEDEDGFVWEKASEGQFFRVQYSASNHLHVDIFPFYSKGDIMTKDTWFATHKQDTSFPQSFLIPLTRVPFAGVNVSAPNHIKEFLEYKFGKGVIENPRYPNQNLPVV